MISEIKLLVSCFDDEPIQRWLFPNLAIRTIASTIWFHSLWTSAQKQNCIWKNKSSVAIWESPQEMNLNKGISFNTKFNFLTNELKKRKPKFPHWYLAAVATERHNRRQSSGTSVLMPVITKCDLDRVPAYLETSFPDSLKFYESLGFKLYDQFDCDSIPVWCLLR